MKKYVDGNCPNCRTQLYIRTNQLREGIMNITRCTFCKHTSQIFATSTDGIKEDIVLDSYLKLSYAEYHEVKSVE